MSVEDALKQNKPKIDMELEKILPRKIDRAWVEWFLGRSAYDCDYETLTKSVSEPIWDFLDRGGKRWRPTLLLWSLEAVGGKPEQFYEFTAMPEFIHNGCVTGDTIIWMADGTPRKIVDIKTGDRVLSLDRDFGLAEKKVEKFFDNGKKEVLKILTSNREVKVTAEHPFLIVSKSQPVRFKVTADGRRLIEKKLNEKDLTISEFAEKILSETGVDMHVGAIKNGLYGYGACLVPEAVKDFVVSYLGISETGCFAVKKCLYGKADVEFKWKKAGELRAGDLVVVAKKAPQPHGILPELPRSAQNPKDRHRLPTGFTLGLAQLSGFLVGDGHIQINYNGGKVVFCIPKGMPGRVEYELLVEQEFGAKPYSGKDNIECCSKALAEMFACLGLKDSCLVKEIPDWVFRLPESYKKAFVKGYIDADGTVTKDGITKFDCANERLMRQFKFLLDSLGFITSNIRKRLIDNSHFGDRAKKKETVLFGFNLNSRARVLEEVGTEIAEYRVRLGKQLQKTHQFKFRDAVPNWPNSFSREFLGFNKITGVEKAGLEQTFDVQIEGTHNYISDGIVTHNTVMADDIEDSSTERRGRPCTHLLYGTDIALNDSNIMYFLPTVLLYRNKKLSPGQKEKIYDLFAEEMMRVSIGQAMDIYWHRHQSVKVSEANYLQMCAYKTGVLARFSAKLGAVLGNASEKQVEALGKFGESLGVAFQIQDDILNLKPESGEWGKEVGDDIQEGKKTLLVIHALANAPKEKAKRLLEILERHSSGKKEIEEAIAIIGAAGSFGYAKEKALEIVEKSWAEAEKVLPESAAKGKLRAFAFFAVKRKV